MELYSSKMMEYEMGLTLLPATHPECKEICPALAAQTGCTENFSRQEMGALHERHSVQSETSSGGCEL